MKFEHLVEINDPHNPLVERLSRAQLWRGLVLRAENPEAFVPALDRCTILEKTELSLSRELHYGDIVVRDSVTFLPPHQVVYQVPAQKDIPASTLTMTIEEPEAGVFFMRFAYDDGASAQQDEANALFDEFRRSAYKEADIDTIRTIRLMAEEGRLGV